MNRQRPEIHPLAYADIEHQCEWLRSHYCSDATLHKFLNAIEEAKLKITNNPETWSKAPGSKRIRKVQIKSFRMTVFYILRKNEAPLVLEVAGPGLLPRWANRLPRTD